MAVGIHFSFQGTFQNSRLFQGFKVYPVLPTANLKMSGKFSGAKIKRGPPAEYRESVDPTAMKGRCVSCRSKARENTHPSTMALMTSMSHRKARIYYHKFALQTNRRIRTLHGRYIGKFTTDFLRAVHTTGP